MKRQLTLIVALLALFVALGAAVGFVRRRVERMDQPNGLSGTNGSAGPSAAESHSHPVGANGNRA